MKWRAALGAACAATTVAAIDHAACGGLTYDLRFSDGSHALYFFRPGDVYSLELWARVSGTNGTYIDEGLSNSYITILSSQTGGGLIASGGLSGGMPATGFNELGSRPGSGSDLNGDGIMDWGATV